MRNEKKDDFVFTQERKESIRDRIKSLFKGRSLRRVSLDWGLPYSTLDNYFSRSATPSVEVLVRISEIENVSLAWLATGGDGVLVTNEAHRGSINHTPAFEEHSQDASPSSFAFTGTPLKNDKFLSLTWSMFFEALNYDEKQKLIDIYAKIGARGVLNILSKYNESAAALSQLSPDEQERLLRLHEQLKKGTPEADRSVAEADLPSDSKKVG